MKTKETFKEKLMAELKKIGWSYRHCGCNIYQIISHHKKGTDFVFDDYSLYMDSDSSWGKDARKEKYHTMGGIKFLFNKCKIKAEDNYVSVSANGAFIMFRGKSK